MATALRPTLHVEVVTAERELYNGEASYVSAPGTEGVLGILPRHAPLLTTLAVGALSIKRGEVENSLFIAGGFLEVSANKVTILANTGEYATEINEARAQEARRRAEERLEEVQSQTERAEIVGALERAVNRLSVAEVARRRSGRHTEVPHTEM